MSDYTEFDKALLAKITIGVNDFTSLCGGNLGRQADAISGPQKSSSRVIDRRLQSLRKRGLIAYSPKTGWTVKDQS